MENCKYCQQNQVVPVLDEEIEQRPRPGNKFRRFCQSCERWLTMCSAKYFRTHPTPHVLPIDEEYPIPLSQSETVERYPVSALAGRTSETSPRSLEDHRGDQGQETRNEILLECILDLTKEGIIDKEAAHQYLLKKLRGSQNRT